LLVEEGHVCLHVGVDLGEIGFVRKLDDEHGSQRER
jgi:hypothetical protein